MAECSGGSCSGGGSSSSSIGCSSGGSDSISDSDGISIIFYFGKVVSWLFYCYGISGDKEDMSIFVFLSQLELRSRSLCML